MSPPIAIVGMACRYPDARSPAELWENVLARRRAFRRIPPERLRLLDYAPQSPNDPDSTYVTHAALLEGYAFDRVRFRVGVRTFQSTDMAHWLALDTADRALADAGFGEAGSLPRDTTGVIVGNTLTGEFSRAAALRLRFPYVRRVAEAALAEAGIDTGDRAAFFERLETRFKAPFAPPDEDTLAGGLSNTIAGRICNHLDLHGGCYTVDGACASSLLAVTSACSSLVAGDLDVALAGGVDLSLDPFELVGFARAGALASDRMRVYDVRSSGFWPGEGAGFVVLMRYDDALASGRRIVALVRGWGISSDGSGGLTRPEAQGQMRAIRRAYARAGFGIDTVGYFEGHGTGTAVGDATELAVLSAARREANPQAPAAAVGSIKANIGHTKAAAGIAGMLKAALALHAQVLPPATGCESPHRELTAAGAPLRVLEAPEPWPRDRPLRAAVSAMGFGGINVHIALEGVGPALRTGLTPIERHCAATQDAELLVLGAASIGELRASLDALSAIAPRISFAELGDVAAALARRAAAHSEARAAIVARNPDELASRLATLSARLTEGRASDSDTAAQGRASDIDTAAGIFFGTGHAAPRIGFLFPGQGAPGHDHGGALARRFAFVRRLYQDNPLPDGGDRLSTAFAQPAILLASLAALSTLHHLGITAHVAVGHSLGELIALHWAGAMDEQMLLRVVRARGAAMAEHGLSGGTMAALKAGALDVEPLLGDDGAVIAGRNALDQTVVSGPAQAVAGVVARARARGIASASLRVSHAFHSPLVAPAAPVFARVLAGERFRPIERRVLSTVTGAALGADCDLHALLTDQITGPVRFLEAAEQAGAQSDLFIEVGPGGALATLVGSRVPAVAIDAGGSSLAGLLSAAGAAFALGAPVDMDALFADRFVRPFDLGRPLRFLANPCEDAPVPDAQPPARSRPARTSVEAETPAAAQADAPFSEPAIEVVSRVVAERTELPREALRPDARLLGDLHLSSITVGGIVTEVARRLGLSPSRAPTEYADSTLAELAAALDEVRSGVQAPEPDLVPGVEGWVRPFAVRWVERPLVSPRAMPPSMQVLAPDGDLLGAALREAFGSAGGPGVAVCLPPSMDRTAVALLLEAARRRRDAGPFIVVTRGGAGAAFARTLHLELPRAAAAVVGVPGGDPRAAGWILAEATAANGFHEARYDGNGIRHVPVLKLLSVPSELGQMPLDHRDVLLVTGGGKGISAECALALARHSGARLLLAGRSLPAADPELAANLDRFAAAGIKARYIAADVTDAAALRGAIHQAAASLGPVTAVLHGAGSNTPALIGSLDEDAFMRTLAVKAQGLQNVLAAIEPDRLRVLVAFSSIIGRAGMRGEADYAVANEALSVLVERFARDHASCKCLCVEWSVWSGAGMGERLGRMEALLRQGITPISLDEGTAMLSRLLRTPDTPVTVVVTGRFGDLPTVDMHPPELPLRRFLEQPRVHVPGVELVADSELSALSDPYLADHVISGEPVLPAVVGLEAMAQVASALVGTTAVPAFEAVRFAGPIIVPSGEKVRLRVAALAQGGGRVDVVLRSEATGFAVNHFTATCRFGDPPAGPQPPLETGAPDDRIAIDPAADLYGTILFHRGRFRRLRGYRRLLARECIAELAAPPVTQWFGRFLPPDLMLGDPGARDAALHAIQVCVPQATLLPVSVERIAPVASGTAAFVRATERSREADTFVYDMAIADAGGGVLERWTGLRLRLVRGEGPPHVWPEPLLGPYLERRVRELIVTGEISVAVHVDAHEQRPARSDRALRHAVGADVTIHRRPDGRPECSSPQWPHVSIAHAGDITLAVAGAIRVACDIEPVTARPPSVWRELLGEDRFRVAERVAGEAEQDLDVAATRIWTAHESARKAGAAPDAALLFAGSAAGGWIVLESGQLAVAGTVVTGRHAGGRLAIAILVEGRRAGV